MPRLSGIDSVEISVAITLLNVSEYKLGIGRNHYGFMRPKSDRALMALPEIVIDTMGSDDDINGKMRMVLDLIWQAFGIEQCTYFDAEGRWSPPN